MNVYAREIPTELRFTLLLGGDRREEKASLLIVRLSTARLRNISLRARIVKLRGRDVIGVASWMERGKNSPSQADIKIPPSSNEGRDRYESFNRGYCYGRDFESLGIRFFYGRWVTEQTENT